MLKSHSYSCPFAVGGSIRSSGFLYLTHQFLSSQKRAINNLPSAMLYLRQKWSWRWSTQYVRYSPHKPWWTAVATTTSTAMMTSTTRWPRWRRKVRQKYPPKVILQRKQHCLLDWLKNTRSKNRWVYRVCYDFTQISVTVLCKVAFVFFRLNSDSVDARYWIGTVANGCSLVCSLFCSIATSSISFFWSCFL